MSTQVHRARADTRTRRMPPSVIGLTGLLALLAVGAIQGGSAMIADPQTPLGMPTSFLDRSPIDTYFWPGVFFLAIAGASVLTIAGTVFSWRWVWADRIERMIGYRWPWIGAMATGSVILTFEVIELFLVPFHPVMHPVLITGSLAILGLTLSRSARAYFRAAQDRR